MSFRYIVVGVLLLGLAAGIGFWQQRLASVHPADMVRLAHTESCDLRAGPCELGLINGGRVFLSVTPREIPPMAPLALEVTVAGSSAEAAWVDFVGVDMDMGFNRTVLSPAGGGRFTGQGMIPVCVRDRMWWEAQVVLDDDGRWFSAPFRFEVARAGGTGAGSNNQ
jgi:hypothetical protein